MKKTIKNWCFFLLFSGMSSFLGGCDPVTVGSAVVSLIPGSFDYIDKNSPSSTQSVSLEEMEEVSIVTLKELDFSITDIKENVARNVKTHVTRNIIAQPAKAKKVSLKVDVQLIKITEKVTKIVVTAKDSSLNYDGATAQAILDEILVNVEMEKSFVDLDKFIVKTEKKKELQKTLEEEKSTFDAEAKEADTVAPLNAAPLQEEAVVEQPVAVPLPEIEAKAPEPEPEEEKTVEEEEPPSLKKKMNEIIASNPVESPFIKSFEGLGTAPYTIKIGTFSNLRNVDRLINEWKRRGQIPFYSSISVREKTLHRVFLNRFPDRNTAKNFVQTLKEGKLLKGEAAQPFKASYAIMAGECLDQGECETKVTKLIASGVSPYLHPVTLEGEEKHLILVGGYTMPEEAKSAMESMENLGLEHSLINP